MLCCQQNNTHIFESQEQYHRCAHMPFNYVFWVSKKGQIVPNMGKHRAKHSPLLSLLTLSLPLLSPPLVGNDEVGQRLTNKGQQNSVFDAGDLELSTSYPSPPCVWRMGGSRNPSCVPLRGPLHLAKRESRPSNR